MIADIAASALMISTALLWTRTLWISEDDESVQIDCAGACVLANAGAIMLWLVGGSPETAMQSWGFHAAGGSLAHFGLTSMARWSTRQDSPGLCWGAARWSSMAYLGVGVISALLATTSP